MPSTFTHNLRFYLLGRKGMLRVLFLLNPDLCLGVLRGIKAQHEGNFNAKGKHLAVIDQPESESATLHHY